MSENPKDSAAEAQPLIKRIAGNPLRIEYFKPGTKPPVYISGSFTSWNPVELFWRPYESSDKPEDVLFFREFPNVPDGEQQYKFRLGPGDWWTTDENVMITKDEHGNKNNVVVVKSDALVTAQSTPAPAASKTTEKGLDRVEQPQPTIAQDRASSQSLADASKPADKMPASKLVEESTKPQSALPETKPTASSFSPVLQASARIATPTTQAAKIAAEVADTAANLDSTSAKKGMEAAEARNDETKKDVAPTTADQAVVNAIAAKTIDQSTGDIKLPPKPADIVTSPSVPPAPAVTPVASSPSLAATKTDSSDSVPPISSPGGPPKESEPTVGVPSVKSKPSRQESEVAALPKISQQGDKQIKPSKQEVGAAAPVPSEISKTTLQHYGLKPHDTLATPATHAPPPASTDTKDSLPPSPDLLTYKTQQQEANEPEQHQAGEFPQDNYKLIKRQTTIRERGLAVFETVMAMPNMIAAFFVSLMSAVTDWLDTTFNPQRRAARAEKGSKSDKGGKEE